MLSIRKRDYLKNDFGILKLRVPDKKRPKAEARKAAAIIDARITRVRMGNLGNSKSVGQGVQ